MNVRFLTTASEVGDRADDISRLLTPVVDEAARGELTVNDILRLAMEGHMYVGLFEDDGRVVMAMAFEFRHYPRKTNLNIVALGGERLDKVAARFWSAFRAWAASAGAAEIEASCSKAMARMLKKYGFADTYELVRLAV